MERNNETSRKDEINRKRNRDISNTNHSPLRVGIEITGDSHTPLPQTSAWSALNKALSRYYSGETAPLSAQIVDHNQPSLDTSIEYTSIPDYKELGIDIDYQMQPKRIKIDQRINTSPVNYSELQNFDVPNEQIHQSFSDHPMQKGSLENLSHNQEFTPKTIEKSFRSILETTKSYFQVYDSYLKSYTHIHLPPDLQLLMTQLSSNLQNLQNELKSKFNEIDDYAKENQNDPNRPANNTDTILSNSISKYANQIKDFGSEYMTIKNMLDTILYNQTQTITDTTHDLSLSLGLDVAFPSYYSASAASFYDASFSTEETFSSLPSYHQETHYPVKVSDGQGNHPLFSWPVKAGNPSQRYAFMDMEGNLYFSDDPFDSRYPTTIDLPLDKQYTLLSRDEDPYAQFSLPTHKEATQYLDSLSNLQQGSSTSDLPANQQILTDNTPIDKDKNKAAIEDFGLIREANQTATERITEKQALKEIKKIALNEIIKPLIYDSQWPNLKNERDTGKRIVFDINYTLYIVEKDKKLYITDNERELELELKIPYTAISRARKGKISEKNYGFSNKDIIYAYNNRNSSHINWKLYDIAAYEPIEYTGKEKGATKPGIYVFNNISAFIEKHHGTIGLKNYILGNRINPPQDWHKLSDKEILSEEDEGKSIETQNASQVKSSNQAHKSPGKTNDH